MYNNYIGWDNGVTGALAIIRKNNSAEWFKMPVKYELSFQKVEQHINRVDVVALRAILKGWNITPTDTLITIERPLLNPMRWKSSISASRCLEATLIVTEELGFELDFIDSKQWQRVLLPGIKGSDELKKASLELGKKLYPNLKLKKDADSLLIAYWAMNRTALEKPKPKRKKEL